jgi:hypothetical protein
MNTVRDFVQARLEHAFLVCLRGPLVYSIKAALTGEKLVCTMFCLETGG